MPIGDIRYTVLEVINEVQRKLGLNATNSLSENKLAVEMVDFINDVCNDLSDFGNWQEMMVSANVTAVSGQRDYSINTSANIKNIADIYFSQRVGPMRNITVQDMRLLTRVTAVGQPTQYSIFGTDNNGNPSLRVRPVPAASEDGGLFSVLYFIRAPKYTTSDTNEIIPFPGDLVVMGVLARAILNESGGAPTDQYTNIQNDYLVSRKEALNRFKGDTGWSIQFSPSVNMRRR